MILKAIKDYGFEKVPTERGFYQKIITPDHCHAVYFRPNGMTEFIHFRFGRVHYSEVLEVHFGGILTMVFPEIKKL